MRGKKGRRKAIITSASDLTKHGTQWICTKIYGGLLPDNDDMHIHFHVVLLRSGNEYLSVSLQSGCSSVQHSISLVACECRMVFN